MAFQRKPGESLGDAMARCAKEQLLPGPMGDKLRGTEYREFISCGMSPPLSTLGDIGKVKTSCAIFVRAVMHWAGRTATRKGVIGQGMFNGWLEGMSNYGPAWVKADPADVLPPGAVFYRDYGRVTNGGHVGIIVQRMPNGLYITAEGGGGDGTECRLSQPKDVWAKDSLQRTILGWWDPAKLGGDKGMVGQREWFVDADGLVIVDGTVPKLPASSLAVFRERVMRWRPEATAAAKKYSVPLHWILGVIWAESGGRPEVVSPDGGYGLMQLTHSSVFQGHSPQATLDDPALNIDLGTHLLAKLSSHLHGLLPHVASGYNAGVAGAGTPHPSSTSPWGVRETPGHIDRVVAGANTALSELKAHDTEPAPPPSMPPQPVTQPDLGYTDVYIKEWQRFIGVKADGKFGPITLAASKSKVK